MQLSTKNNFLSVCVFAWTHVCTSVRMRDRAHISK